MKAGLSAAAEIAAGVLLTMSLYFLALVNFPVFQGPHALILNLVDDRLLPFSIPAVVTASSVLFGLAGALLMSWSPAMSPRMMAGLWVSIYLLYWVDPVITASVEFRSPVPLASAFLGTVFLVLFFVILSRSGEGVRPLYQAATWRSRFARGWMVTWMGFFLGLSAVLVSGGPNKWGRAGISTAVLVLSCLCYSVVELMQKAEGDEKVALGSAWRWMSAAWGLMAAANLLARRFLDF